MCDAVLLHVHSVIISVKHILTYRIRVSAPRSGFRRSVGRRFIRLLLIAFLGVKIFNPRVINTLDVEPPLDGSVGEGEVYQHAIFGIYLVQIIYLGHRAEPFRPLWQPDGVARRVNCPIRWRIQYNTLQSSIKCGDSRAQRTR